MTSISVYAAEGKVETIFNKKYVKYADRPPATCENMNAQ